MGYAPRAITYPVGYDALSQKTFRSELYVQSEELSYPYKLKTKLRGF
jgi:hypothetical protein